jgi:cardiolipin synthase
MADAHALPLSSEAKSQIRIMAEQAFSRAAGAPLLPGNRVRLLRDAQENYPAWLEAIGEAKCWIHFESYIIHEDEQGRIFAEALKAKARAGVAVRLIYDWMGAVGKTSRKFWQSLREAGVEVRCFNPLRLDNAFGWLSRDHRKMLAVDGQRGFVTGLCVGCLWKGQPEKGIEPWRDTGVEVRGPAVAEIEQAFAQMWEICGAPLPAEEIPDRQAIDLAGEVTLRIVASQPNTAGLYRLDQLIAAGARNTLWLTDAYYAGTTPYVQALRAAARDQVDVRLLVPQATDIPMIRALSRSGYRLLLEAGVRVFEWNGSMLHAKTAVVDGKWARVGSTNLNLASWIGNWELDVVIEDEEFGAQMMQMYLDDLSNATEIILSEKKRLQPLHSFPGRRRNRLVAGSSSGMAAGAIRAGRAVSAAFTNRRLLGPAESRVMFSAALLLLAVSVVAVLWPRVVTVPLAIIGLWIALTLLIQAYKLHRQGQQEKSATTIAKAEVHE